MRIALNDVTYDLAEAVSKATLNDLMELKVKTRGQGEGVSVKSIRTAFLTMGERFKEIRADKDERTEAETQELVADAFLSLLSNEEFLANFVGVMFLARRHAGERVSVEEAGNFAFNDIEWLLEPDGEDEPEGDDAAPFTEADAAVAVTT